MALPRPPRTAHDDQHDEIRLRRHGIPPSAARTAALRQLVLQAPALVVTTMLGYSHDHTARTATTAGTTWSHYTQAITRGYTTSELTAVGSARSPGCSPQHRADQQRPG